MYLFFVGESESVRSNTVVDGLLADIPAAPSGRCPIERRSLYIQETFPWESQVQGFGVKQPVRLSCCLPSSERTDGFKASAVKNGSDWFWNPRFLDPLLVCDDGRHFILLVRAPCIHVRAEVAMSILCSRISSVLATTALLAFSALCFLRRYVRGDLANENEA